jgi:membrane protein
MLAGVIHGLLAQPRGGLLSVGAVLALWAASSAFVSVMDGLNQAYRVPESRPWWRVRLTAIGLTVALSAFMIVGFVLAVFGGALVSWIGQYLGPAGVPILLVVRWVVVILVITLVVAAMYYACPDVEQEWHWVTPGSLMFTLGFGVTSAGFSYYVSHFGAYEKTYGSLGAVIILLAWMYMLAFFLLFGGQVNALLEHMSPAGKAPGDTQVPAVDEQAGRVARDERVRA